MTPPQSSSLVNSALAVATVPLSILLALPFGYATLGLTNLGGPPYGRNPFPLILCSLGFLVIAGFAYQRWFYRGLQSCLLGTLGQAALVSAVVIHFAGGLMLDWAVLVLAATLLPWLAGLGLGRLYARWAAREAALACRRY